MSISVNWANKVITIPQNDLTFVESGVYELDMNDFKSWVQAEEESESGICCERIMKHNTEVSLGGVTYARTIEIINGYTVTFEDGQYAVNLTGANNNLADVLNVNQVSCRSANTAGMVGLTEQNALLKKIKQMVVMGI